ncbi:hypothetical protein FRX31_020759 [Thalictrum thalictroides]|uniref:RNase H type-1 domain-containing protein n=1 Tax=Thalictrum thalictroides TaxID=46969 RepID=A0A7J6VX14_THATH|nr:hypothetical protein FRX31_020759 [Thalictrum thalictroides]
MKESSIIFDKVLSWTNFYGLELELHSAESVGRIASAVGYRSNGRVNVKVPFVQEIKFQVENEDLPLLMIDYHGDGGDRYGNNTPVSELMVAVDEGSVWNYESNFIQGPIMILGETSEFVMPHAHEEFEAPNPKLLTLGGLKQNDDEGMVTTDPLGGFELRIVADTVASTSRVNHLDLPILTPLSTENHIEIPPPPDFIKINVDISLASSDTPMGIGYIIRSSNGDFIYAATESGNAADAGEGECKGLLSALRAGLNRKLMKAVIESDCKNAICFLTGNDINISWAARTTLEQVRDLSKHFICGFYLL